MKLSVKKIEIEIDQKDALSIINALQTGIPENERFKVSLPSVQFLQLLTNNFINSSEGINFPKK